MVLPPAFVSDSCSLARAQALAVVGAPPLLGGYLVSPCPHAVTGVRGHEWGRRRASVCLVRDIKK